MIELRLHPRTLHSPTPIYGIAGQRIACDTPLAELAAFRTRESERDADRTPRRATDDQRASLRQRVFHGPAELGARRFLLDCSWQKGGYRLAVDGLGNFAIDAAGERIRFDRCEGVGDSDGLAEIALGPSLILALALNDVWCLHASAVRSDGGILAFVGTSGKGKSTLAAALPKLAPRSFRCAADDVLPVTLEGKRPRALPHFPQLKYRPDQQPGSGTSPSLPLRAIYLLDPETARSDRVDVQPMTGAEAVLSLVRHTHAARLFTHELLRRHTDICARLAAAVPVRRLLYRHQRGILGTVAEALRREAGALQ